MKRSLSVASVEVTSQEFVVGGYRVGKNCFDNLAIGYYEDERLLFIAKLKNGFTPAAKKAIYDQLKKLETTKCPFDNLPEPNNARLTPRVRCLF